MKEVINKMIKKMINKKLKLIFLMKGKKFYGHN